MSAREHAARLSVCVPVFRRPALLRKCLISLIAAIGDENVPIVISDDSGDDTNAAVIADARRSYSRIEWHRNPSTLGIDRNILLAVSQTESDYAWVLGEDDLITPRSIGVMLGLLSSSSPAFLFVNYSYVSNDYGYYLRRRVVDMSTDLNITARQFTQEYAWAMGFIGSCVVRKASWMPREEFIGTYYAHVGSILSAVSNEQVTMIAEPLVLNRAENNRSFSWADKAFDVFFGWERMLTALHQLNPYFDLKTAVRNSEVLFRHRSLAWLVSKRADGVYDRQVLAKDRRIGCESRTRRGLAFLIAISPPIMCRAIKFMFRDVPRLARRERIGDDIVPPSLRGEAGG